MDLIVFCSYNCIYMTKRKTRKLTCIVTGRQLIATREYYDRKVEKNGGEEKLHRTYICREAKRLIRSGSSVDKVREVLNVDSDVLSDVPQDVVNDILSTGTKINSRRISNITSISNIVNSKTDDDVKQYINSLIK
jgi:hypothetical protein